MRKSYLILLSLFCVLHITAQVLPYKNPNLSASERAADLCSRLTLEEKARLLIDESEAVHHLQIPDFPWWSEALHGVARNGYATVFPMPIAMAASFDDRLLYDVFCAVSDEARAKNNLARIAGTIRRNAGLSFWTPNINIFRDPRWGRGMETYGEDPFLTSRMGCAVVRGLQGQHFDATRPEGNYYKLLACAKHFAVHSGPESERHRFNIESLPERDLHETYLPAFRSLVQDAGVQQIMCAYNSLDGKPCCGNDHLEHMILRNDWKYDGMIVSDCGAISDFWNENTHNVVDSAEDASVMAVVAGTDVECGENYKAIPEAVRKGKLSMEALDRSVRRMLRARFLVGDFDNEDLVEYKKIGPEAIVSKEHKELAYRMALESIVLLQNRNKALPLNKDARILVMGPNANDSVHMLGNYNGFPTGCFTYLHAIRDKATAKVDYVRGCDFLDGYNEEDIRKAEPYDVVVFIGGISPRLEGEELPIEIPSFKGGDRMTIELPQVQRQVMSRLHTMGKKVIFVNCSGSAMALEPETHHADAIVQAWYSGEKGGIALADILFGDDSPSGKLPVTFYSDDSQLPPFTDYTMKNRTYRYFHGSPLYPFGYGLTYTTFTLGQAKYDGKYNDIRIILKNTGKRRATEVVQLYFRRIDDVNGPLKSLCSFKRVTLDEGQTAEVVFHLNRRDLCSWDSCTNTIRFVPGKYAFFVGTSSADKDLKRVDITLK